MSAAATLIVSILLGGFLVFGLVTVVIIIARALTGLFGVDWCDSQAPYPRKRR